MSKKAQMSGGDVRPPSFNSDWLSAPMSIPTAEIPVQTEGASPFQNLLASDEGAAGFPMGESAGQPKRGFDWGGMAKRMLKGGLSRI